MAEYPTTVASYRTIENRKDIVYDSANKTTFYAEDLRKLQDEQVAVQEALGTEPYLDKATVKAKLQDIQHTLHGGKETFAEVYNASSHNVDNKTFKRIPFSSVAWDTDALWDGNNSKFTIKKAGLYYVEGRVQVETTAGIYRYILRLGGVSTHSVNNYRRLIDTITGGGGDGDSESGNGISGSTLVPCEVGDDLWLSFWHNVGSTRTYPHRGDDRRLNHFTIRRVSGWTP